MIRFFISPEELCEDSVLLTGENPDTSDPVRFALMALPSAMAAVCLLLGKFLKKSKEEKY